MNEQVTNRTWPWQFDNARARKTDADPWQRLRDAIICQAVIDLVRPLSSPAPTLWELRTARMLVQQHRATLREMGIPVRKIDYLLAWLDADDIATEATHVP